MITAFLHPCAALYHRTMASSTHGQIHTLVLVALLAAALLLTAAGTLTPEASAQSPPEWQDDGRLAIEMTVESHGSTKCARLPTGSPYLLNFLNQSVELYGVCGYAARTYHPLRPDACGEDNDEDCPAYYSYGNNRQEVHFSQDTDFDRFDAFRDIEVQGVRPYKHIAGSETPSEVTYLTNQPTSRLRTPNDPRGTATEYNSLAGMVDGVARTVTFTLGDPVADYLASGSIPETPEQVAAIRNGSYDAADLTWEAYDVISEYEIERLTAVTVAAGQATRVEYGDLVRFSIEGTIEGVDRYIDDTVEVTRTYQYRIRARSNVDDWSSWSSYVFSGAKPDIDIDAPANVSVSREHDNSEVTLSWSAPDGTFDSYTVQREELTVLESSTFFANTTTLGGATWLPGTSLTYNDADILPEGTYQYRVAAVKDDLVGEYSEWYRTTPVRTSLGSPPEDLRIDEDNELDDRREVWLEWDAVDGADDYQVQVSVTDPLTRAAALSEAVYTANRYFHTGFSRAELRVRARKHDDDLCGSGDADRCLSGWTGWLPLGFEPVMTVDAPDLVITPPAPDAEAVAMRAGLVAAIGAATSTAGVTVNAGALLNLGILVLGLVPGLLSTYRGQKAGMIGVGMGMGVMWFLMILALGYRLAELPAEWTVAVLIVLLVGGVLAAASAMGMLRR